MRLRRPIAFILSAAVAASALTGCNSFSGHAAAAANSAQVQQLIEFIADLGLERDLRQALQSGGDLRQALLTLLGLENAVNFNVDDLTGARPGQHAVQVWEVTAQSAEDAAALAASQIRAVLEQLKSNGVTEGRIGMVEVDGKYYVVVDVEVTEENTFEPIRPVSDDDDDSEEESSDSQDETIIEGVTEDANDLLTIDVAKLGLSQNTGITAAEIINTINKEAEVQTGEAPNYDKDSIKVLDLSNCAGLTSIGKSGEHPGAFQWCSQLTKVTLPESLESIGDRAFAESGLTEINLGDCASLKSIGVGAFASSGLTSINLSGCISLKSIDKSAFRNCASLETVLLPANLEEIGIEAFWGCTGLTRVTLPAKLTTIGGWAFQNCSGLTDITFYRVPTEIETGAFYGVNAKDLTVYYNPSTCDLTELKAALEKGGLEVDEKSPAFEPDTELTPLTYLLGL